MRTQLNAARQRALTRFDRANPQNDSGAGRLSLLVIVEGTDVLKARRAIVQSGDAHIELVRCIPIPHSSRVRLVVELDASALEETLVRITGSLERGELGRVVKVHA
ncbi:MAG TPA: hypothetical protein VLV56_05565, partial [Burkholderiales bacterium]|nr:hypothetical protein [Burkholderiales bacterium]